MANRYGFTFYGRLAANVIMTNFASHIKGYAAQHPWGGNGLLAPNDSSDGNATSFGFRQPIRISNPAIGWWYYTDTGDPVTDQAKVDEQINMLADAGFTCICMLYYGRIADFQTSNPGTFPVQVKLWNWFDYYMASAYKNRLKFAVMGISRYCSFDVNSGAQPAYPPAVGTWLNLPDVAAYWASLMGDSQYMRDRTGKPFLYLFDDNAAVPWTLTEKATIQTAMTNAGIPALTYVLLNKSLAGVDTFGGQFTQYGPAGAGLTGNQNAYLAQINVDRSNWLVFSPGDAKEQTAITAVADAQPLHGIGSIWWADRATYTQAEQHVAQTMAFVRAARNHIPDQALVEYSDGEISEGGDWFPTRQSIIRGVNTPSRGFWLDAYKNVVNNTRPSTYTDHYHATSKHSAFVRTGGTNWSIVFGVHNGGGANIAPFDFKEALNTTLNDTLTFTPPGKCTRIRLYGVMGPGLGTFNAQTDGGSATLVNQSAVSTSYGNLLYDTGTLSAASHNVKLTVVTGCRIDEFKVDVSR